MTVFSDAFAQGVSMSNAAEQMRMEREKAQRAQQQQNLDNAYRTMLFEDSKAQRNADLLKKTLQRDADNRLLSSLTDMESDPDNADQIFGKISNVDFQEGSPEVVRQVWHAKSRGREYIKEKQLAQEQVNALKQQPGMRLTEQQYEQMRKYNVTIDPSVMPITEQQKRKAEVDKYRQIIAEENPAFKLVTDKLPDDGVVFLGEQLIKNKLATQQRTTEQASQDAERTKLLKQAFPNATPEELAQIDARSRLGILSTRQTKPIDQVAISIKNVDDAIEQNRRQIEYTTKEMMALKGDKEFPIMNQEFTNDYNEARQVLPQERSKEQQRIISVYDNLMKLQQLQRQRDTLYQQRNSIQTVGQMQTSMPGQPQTDLSNATDLDAANNAMIEANSGQSLVPQVLNPANTRTLPAMQNRTVDLSGFDLGTYQQAQQLLDQNPQLNDMLQQLLQNNQDKSQQELEQMISEMFQTSPQ